MNSSSLILTVEKPGEETIYWAIPLLRNAGLRVIRTFDLQEARFSHSDCPCPHHGLEACNCQISVLLVYHGELPPASVLIHSYQETTWLYIVDTPEHPVNHGLDKLLRDTLTQPVPSSIENSEDTLV